MKQQRRENSVSNWSKGKGFFIPSGPTGFMSFEHGIGYFLWFSTSFAVVVVVLTLFACLKAIT
jgi:hypothetical protein